MKINLPKLLLFSALSFLYIKVDAQCPTVGATQVKVCNDAGGNSTITAYFYDGVTPTAAVPYLLFDLVNGLVSQPVGSVPFSSIPAAQLPPTALYGVQFTSVPNGDYVIRVNCSPSGFVVIGGSGINVNSANSLTAGSTLLHPDCFPASGTGNGQIRLTVNNGTPPYQIVWSASNPTSIVPGSIATSGGTLNTPANLDAGSYAATITDANNCIFNISIPMPVSTSPVAGPNQAVCGTLATLAGNSPGAGEIGTWTAVTPGTYTFSPDANTPNAIVSGLNISVTNTFRWTIVDIGGVCAPGTSDDVDIFSNPIPTVTITDPAAVCSPSTVDITAAAVTAGSTAGLTYTYWTDAIASISLANPNAVSASGTYYIKGTTGASCSTIQPVHVTINPSPTVTITDPAAVCSPSTVDITAAAVTAGSTAGLTYTYWTDAIASISLANPNAVSASGTYYIKGTTGASCSTIQPVHVTINPSPTVTITDPAAVCSPSTVDITAAAVTAGSTAGLTYTYWTDAIASISLANPNAVSASGTYYIKGTTGASCSTIQPVHVTINPSPTVTITDPAAVCSPSTVDITAAAVTAGSTAGLTYTYWTDAIASISLANPNAVSASGTYYIKGTTGASCSTIQPVHVTINPSPTVTITDPAAVCSPSTVDITAAAVTAGSTAGLTYTYWTDAIASISLANPNAVSASGTYYIKGTTGASCSTIQPVHVTINPSPTVTITDPAAVCSPSTVDITAAAVTAGSTAGLTYTYWTDAIASISLANPNAVSASGTYYIKGTTGASCSTIQPVHVTINPSPTVTITDPAAVCSPSTVDITAAAVTAGSTAGLTYTYWTDAIASISLANPNAVSASGTYYIKGTTGASCSTIQPVHVTINPSPTVTITDPAAVCSPSTVDITAAAVTAGSTAGLTYTYWTDAIASISLANPNAVSASGTYYIKGTTGASCSTIQPVHVTINPSPTVTITDPAAVCSPSTVDITAAAVTAGSTAGLTYTYWTDAIASISLANPNAVSASGTYYIKGTTGASCSTIQPVHVTINPSPTVTITDPAAVCSPSTVDITAAAVTAGSTAGLTYTYWTDAIASISLANPNAVSASGTYYIKGTTGASCSTIQPVHVTINPSPTVTITDPAAVCSPSTVDITAAAVTAGSTAGLTYTYWTDAIASISLANPNAVSASGTYYIKGTTGASCSTIQPVHVTINPLPVASTPSASLCIGSTMALSPSSGGTWVSNSPGVATIAPATGVVTGVAVGSVTFTFTNTATSCSSTTTSVTINPLPTAPTGADVTVCFDGSAHTGSTTPGAGESIVWYTASSGGSVTTAPTGTTAGTYTAFAASKNNITGCESPTRTQVKVIINTLPTVTFTAGATTICAGSSSTYTTQSGQNNYVWSVTGGSITSGGTVTDNTATIQWSSTGSVTVNYQDANSCSAAAPTSLSVTVDALPTVAAAGSDQTNVCGTASLGGNTPSTGTGSWGFAPVPGGIADGLGNILTPNSPTSGFNGTPGKTYTLRWTISNGTCPSTSDDVAIGFDPAGVTPSAAGSDQNQCNNGSFTLAGNSPTSGTGTWTIVGSTNGATITSPSLNNSTVTGLNLGTSVTLRWTISNGASCTSIDDVVLSNNDNPTAAAAGLDQAACGTSTTLTGNTPTVGTGAWTITSGTGGSITNTANPISVFNGTQGSSYTLRWTISNGACSPSFDDVNIAFDKTPTTAVAGPDILNACGTISLSANNPTVGVGQWTITSNPDNLGNVATPSSNVSNFNGSAGITYVLTWTISNGSCPNSTDDVQIQYSPTGPTAANAGSDQDVCGTSTTLSGNIPIAGTGQWSFASGGNPDGLGAFVDVNNQSSGFSGTEGQTYKLVWTISSGTCASIDQVTIQFGAPPTTSAAGTDQSSCTTSTTLAANTPSIGTGVWSFAPGGNPDGLGAIANINNSLSGFSGTAGQVYILTWTISSSGCSPSTDDVKISINNISLITFNQNYCQNAGTLDLTTLVSATPTGGTLTFTGPQVTGSNFDPTGLTGAQNISVKYDQNSCTVTKPLLINVLLASNAACSGSGGGGGGCSVAVIGKTDATCSGVNNGAINISSVTGGTGPYTISIQNGAAGTFTGSFPGSHPTFSNLSGNTNYSVIVKDATGCISSVNSIFVNNITTISGTVSKTDASSCSIAGDGTITITSATGGTAPYSYSIDGGLTFPPGGSPFTSLARGSYSVVIKDAGGCLSTPVAITIGTTSNITPVIGKTDASCSGVNNGSITVSSVTGGTTPYTISIDNGGTFPGAFPGPSPTFGNLSGNTNYSVVVKDANGCISSVNSIFVNNIVTISGTVTKTDVTCAGGDGTITITPPTSGTSPYFYSIDGGLTFPGGNSFTGLSIGTYDVVIKDSGGCLSAVTSTAIVSNCSGGGSGNVNCGKFNINVTEVRPTCSNQNNGQISITISGGTPSPNYVVTLYDSVRVPHFIQGVTVAPSTAFTFNNLSPSLDYHYKVDDGTTSCTLPYSLQIQTTVQASAAGFVDAKCFNQPVGQATVTVSSGGASPYEYSIDAGTTWIAFTSPVTITNLRPDTTASYSILVRDDVSDLCPAQVSVTIKNAVKEIKTSFTATDASCSNNDGTIQIGAVNGGTAPYTYRLDSVDYAALPANNTFTGLAGGIHKFTVIDAIGCSKYFKTKINFPGLVDFTTIFNNPDCSGNGSNGNIVVEITSSGTFDVGITTDPANDPTKFRHNITSSGSTFVKFDSLSQGYYYVVAKPIGALCPTRSSQIQISGGPVAVDFTIIPEDFVCFETKGIARIAGIKGSSLVDYNYQIILAGNIIQSGTITQLQALPPDTINYTDLDKGNYQMILFQDQSASSGCTSPISSSYKSFSINGPVASLDTLYVNRTFSLPNIASGSMLIGIKESQSEPYQLMLHLVNPHLSGQKNKQAFDSTWVSVSRNSQTLIMEFYANYIYGGDYRLSIRDTLGCTKTYDLSLDFDKDIIVPNVFTPNNDGKNDTFQILNLPDDSKLVITNRWGKEVYQSSNYQNNWNGGSEVDGVYYYNLTAGGKVYTGWVEIMHPSY